MTPGKTSKNKYTVFINKLFWGPPFVYKESIEMIEEKSRKLPNYIIREFTYVKDLRN